MLVSELIPAQDPSSKRVMLVLHGLGDSMEGYRGLPGELRLPWLNYLLVNAPDAYFMGYSWYDIYGDAEPGVSRSRAMLFELLDSLPARGFAPEDTAVFGFSQGCLMTIEVAGRYPSRLGGFVGVSGYVHEPEKLIAALSPVARDQKTLFTHGTRDPLIPLEPARQQVETLRQAGLQIEWHEFEKEHSFAGEPEFAVIRQFLEARLG